MHYALPPRKSSTAPPYTPRTSFFTLQRRRQLRTIGLVGFVILSSLFILSRLFSSSSSSSVGPVAAVIASGTPNVVVVTVLDYDLLPESYVQKIQRNREDYASRHGYGTFFANTSDYAYTLNGQPRSWASVPAVRHAMSKYLQSTYFFYLSPYALIMEPRLSLTSHVVDHKRLESLMIKDHSVVPPDSVIKTFGHLKGRDVQLIVTQDGQDLVSGSFIIKQGDWARFFLDVWYDPLYRAYNFAKAEKHALDHIVQWHATMLTKLALIPQRVINAYSKDSPDAAVDGTYQDGDFVIHFSGCENDNKRVCEEEMQPYYSMWLKSSGQKSS